MGNSKRYIRGTTTFKTMDFFTSPHRDFWASNPPPMMACRFDMPSAAFPPAASDNDRTATVNEDGSVEFSVPVEGFSPEDIEIIVSDDGMLRLKASREEKDAKGNVVSSRRVNKSLSLPPDCNVEAIHSKLNQKEGTLKIVAPRKARQVEEEKRAETVEPRPEKQERESTEVVEPVELASVAVEGFAPEELSVQVSEDGRSVEVGGRQEDRDDSEAVVSSKQFSKTFPIPLSVDPESVSSQLSKQGILSVTADKKKNL